MKRKCLLFIFLILFSFISCNLCNTEKKIPDNSVPEKKTEDETKPSEKKQKGTVSFKNQSNYEVNVYLALSPYYGSPTCTVQPKGTVDYSFIPSDDSLGDVFWFEYLIKLGNAVFPYCSNQPLSGYKYIKVPVNEKKILEIDDLVKCETKSAYFLLENSTASSIRLMNSASPMHDAATGNVLIESGSSAVYEIAPSKTEATLGGLGLVKIKVDNAEVALPVSNSDVVAGNVYTINVNNNDNKLSASLKAISPFNVDTARKMWGFSESSFLYNWDDRITPVIKPAYDKEKGSIMMGTLKNQRNKIGLLPVDQYGKYPETMDVLEAWTQNIPKDKIDTLIVSDFVEQSDGSFVMLLSCWDENYYVNNMLLAFDFSKNLPLWDYDLPEDILFRHDSANKLIRLEDNKVVIAGGIIVEPENPEDYGEDDPYPMSPYIGLFDYTKKSDDGLTYLRNEEGCKTYTMDTPFDNESLFCSVYYDGSNIFASGFTDFDPDYNLDHDHDGIIYKFNADLSEPTEIYKKPNCLFFTLSGNGNKWYACGEYWLKASDRLLGCYVSSTMIAENKNVNPAYYFGTNPYTWFNQLCTYDNMIVMCGQSSLNKNGTESPLPFVVAYDAQGNMLWENLSYKKWATALNVIPNTIGTYILQLTDKDNRQIHFVSADFLGNEVTN